MENPGARPAVCRHTAKRWRKFWNIRTLWHQMPSDFTTAYDEYAIKAFKGKWHWLFIETRWHGWSEKGNRQSQEIVKTKADYPKDIRQLLQMITQTAGILYELQGKNSWWNKNNWIPVFTKTLPVYRDNLNYIITFSGENISLIL